MTAIPAHLDAPLTLILWPVDECVSFALPFFSAFFGWDAPLSGLGVGSVVDARFAAAKRGGRQLFSGAFSVLVFPLAFAI